MNWNIIFPKNTIGLGIIHIISFALCIPAFIGFIKLFQESKDYKLVSKTIKIQKNTSINGCLTNLAYDNSGNSKIFYGNKNSIKFIAFIAFWLLFFCFAVLATYLIIIIVVIYNIWSK